MFSGVREMVEAANTELPVKAVMAIIANKMCFS